MGGPKKSKGKEPKKELQVVSSAEQENMELATKASTECPRRPFWTHGYREEQGRNGRCSRGGPGNGRDECIRQECRDAGLQWGNGGDYDEGQWRDQGNWYFAGWCSCGSHTGNNAAGGEQNVQKTGPKKASRICRSSSQVMPTKRDPRSRRARNPRRSSRSFRLLSKRTWSWQPRLPLSAHAPPSGLTATEKSRAAMDDAAAVAPETDVTSASVRSAGMLDCSGVMVAIMARANGGTKATGTLLAGARAARIPVTMQQVRSRMCRSSSQVMPTKRDPRSPKARLSNFH